MPRSALHQFRRGTAAEWAAANPVLAAGEPGFETDTGILRIGDGITAYMSLGGSGGEAGTDWNVADAWDQFSVLDVSATNNASHTYIESTLEGRGILTGDTPGGGSDRRILLFDGVEAGDCEVQVEYSMSAATVQPGIAARIVTDEAGDTNAVAINSNVVFGAVGSLNISRWGFNDTSFHTNTVIGTHTDPRELLRIEGDGTTVTVHTAQPHALRVGDTVEFNDVGSFPGSGTITAVPSASSFAITNATTGSEDGGTYRDTFRTRTRVVKARFVGDRVLVKMWPSSHPEPSWGDTVRVSALTLPGAAALRGGVGLIVNHLAGNVMEFGDFRIRHI